MNECSSSFSRHIIITSHTHNEGGREYNTKHTDTNRTHKLALSRQLASIARAPLYRSQQPPREVVAHRSAAPKSSRSQSQPRPRWFRWSKQLPHRLALPVGSSCVVAEQSQPATPASGQATRRSRAIRVVSGQRHYGGACRACESPDRCRTCAGRCSAASRSYERNDIVSNRSQRTLFAGHSYWR